MHIYYLHAMMSHLFSNITHGLIIYLTKFHPNLPVRASWQDLILISTSLLQKLESP